jgi:hypothetical protein
MHKNDYVVGENDVSFFFICLLYAYYVLADFEFNDFLETVYFAINTNSMYILKSSILFLKTFLLTFFLIFSKIRIKSRVLK